MKRRTLLNTLLNLLAVLALLALVLPVAPAMAAKPVPPAQTQLPGTKIAQFVDQLPMLQVAGGGFETVIAGAGEIDLNMLEVQTKMMPSTFVPANGQPYTGTWNFSYRVGPTAAPATAVDTYIGPFIVASRGTPTQVRYSNNLTDNHMFWRSWTDQSLHSVFHQVYGQPMPTTGNAAHYPGPIPAVPHLHGAEDPAVVDGGPEAWFLSNQGNFAGVVNTHGSAYYTKAGAAANEAIYVYPNSQLAAPLWFHDHVLGATRVNATFAGLAGAYAITDPNLTLPAGLLPVGLDRNGDNTYQPSEYSVPLVIQDRMFDTNGQLFFPNAGINPTVHPYWIPEFVGDTIVVNGRVWPYMSVDQQRYRFYLVNGSNSRPYTMHFETQSGSIMGPPMYVIATDGGYLDTPIKIDPAATSQQIKAGALTALTMMPGERYEIIVDFADPTWLAMLAKNNVKLPLNLILTNTAPTVNGKVNNQTDGHIMQFRVSATKPTDSSYNPAGTTPILSGANQIVRLVNPATGTLAAGVTANVTRLLELNEVAGPGGPLEVLLNNSKWMGHRPDMSPIPGSTLVNGNYLTELPKEGEIELWEIVNTTMDQHPIHLHGVQFQLMNRQAFDTKAWATAYAAAFPGGVLIPGYGPPLDYFTGNPSGKWGGNPDPVLVGLARIPLTYEAGWKDTMIAFPGEVMRIAVRIAPQDTAIGTTGFFPYVPNPLAANGLPAVYVWHCHITDHEDNEMMRPDMFVPFLGATRTFIQGTNY